MVPSARRGLRAIGAIALAAFLTVAFTPVPSLLDRALGVGERLEPAAAIVVLGGGGVRGDDDLSDVSLRRLMRGVQLYQQGLAPRLVVSGPRGHGGGPAEADVRARIARRLGIPDAAVVAESSARTTAEESTRIAGLLQPLGIRRILLVADRQGMRRAAALFRRAGFEVLPAPADDVANADSAPEARLELLRRVLIELTALTYYHVAGAL